jgi:hypothetical protein
LLSGHKGLSGVISEWVVQAGGRMNNLGSKRFEVDVRKFCKGMLHKIPQVSILNASGEYEKMEWQGRIMISRF